MRQSILAMGLGVVALAASSSIAGVRTIDMVIQSDTFDNFQFSVLHTASSGPDNASGSILASFTGRFTIEVDDVAETIEFTNFRGDIGGTSRSDDIRLAADPSRGASSFSMTSGNLVVGSLKLDIFDGGTFKAADFSFDGQAFNALANQFFDRGEDPQGSNRETIGLWGLSQQFNGNESILGDNRIGIDLVGRAIPMPTPLAMAGMGLLGVAGVRRRR